MHYDLKALRNSRDIASLRLEASDEGDQISQARSHGCLVLSARARRAWSMPQWQRRRAFPLLLFSQELLVLLDAGLPLIEALDGLGEKERNHGVQAVIHQICTDLREGKTFSAALQ